MSFKEKANTIKCYIPALFLALKRKDTPKVAKFFAYITVGYALSPIDLVPDFIPILGYLDDLLLLPMLIMLTLKFIPQKIFDECKKKAEGLWENGKPTKWYYAIPIVIIWVLIILIIVKIIVSFLR